MEVTMAKWTKETLKTALEDKGWRIVCRRDIQGGVQFELEEGVKVDLYGSGKSPVRGPQSKFKSEVEDFVDAGPNGAASESGKSSSGRRVFVVYGHDTTALDQLKLILLGFGVKPIVLQDIPGVGDTLIGRLDLIKECEFACVLLTPDDVGAEKRKQDNWRPRARQNVVLELGMALGKLGQKRVAILVKGEEIEKPSDIDGLINIPYKESVKEVATELGAAMENVGFRKISATELASV